MVRTSFFFVSCAFAGTSAAFAFGPPQVSLARKIDSKLHIFGGLGDAFKNDDSLGERKNDGLSGVSPNSQLIDLYLLCLVQ